MSVTAVAPVLRDHGLAILAISAAVFAFYKTFLAASLPKDIPLVREKPGRKGFSLRTRISFYLDCSRLYRDVWDKFSKKGKPVVVPTLGPRKEIFLPHSSIKWAISQPANILGMWEAFNDNFQLQSSLGDEKYMLDTWVHHLTRHVLTGELENHIMPVYEELQLAIDARLGHNTEEWRTLDLLDTMRMIGNQAGSRFGVGLPLCRDEEYLRTIMDTIDGVLANAGIIGLLPSFLRPVAAPVVCWGTRKGVAKLEAKCDPVFKERIAYMESNPDESNDPGDFLQKMLRYAHQKRPEELATDQMTRRLLVANLGFTYLAGFAMCNMLLNILASDSTYSTVDVLRQEAETFLNSATSHSELWKRKSTSRMVYVDSVARETLRLNNLPTRTLARQVMVDGLKTDDGTPLPRGSFVSFVSQPMHTDAEHFENPNTFDPFRFVRLRKEEAEAKGSKASTEAGGAWSQHSFLSTANLLVFGRGRNSCAGRFLLDFELKMMVSYLLTNYDIKFPDEYQNKRPANRWLLEFIFPDKRAKIQVRRRKPVAVNSEK
ncbi:hypothetical protein LOZ61_006119 [Ophidiomyces ophidiicola]|nr:hypothetical protein LOZ61_006119 [Ophidiomyces ophidiicola]KAI1923548.1 hypothetical protein LOZ60_005152 [Ophidiomyces ophidiicola]KAI2149588.1 hypothetical protein LOZ27_000739 [Ophidiomyces ophidiicola]KAI2378011.1 hypothetical protein LOY89_002055 [Ophidiomyces ophidiicola]KAI2409403.1 hypothetical protein LOY90_002699 [Ophidiomyces ophidiicola]